MIVTLKELKRVGACKGEVARFEKLFGERVRITKKLCLEHAQDVDWGWTAGNLLKQEAWNVYHADCLAAWEGYLAAIQPARGGYLTAIQPAQEVCVPAERPAWVVYRATQQSAKKVYNKALALAFYKATLK